MKTGAAELHRHAGHVLRAPGRRTSPCVKAIINQVSVVDFQSADRLRRRQQAVRLLHHDPSRLAALGRRPRRPATCGSTPRPGGRSAVIAVATWILLRTRAGNWIFAVGGAQTSARQVGVPVVPDQGRAVHDHGRSPGWIVGMLTALQDHHGPAHHRRRPGVRLHHLRRRRRLPADRRLRLGDRRRPRRPDLRHGQPGHRLRRAGTTTGSRPSSA